MLTAVLTRGLEHIGDSLIARLHPDGPSGWDPGHGAVEPVGGEPVVLIGGLAATAPLLRPMTRWLEASGYAVTGFAVGTGLDCAQHTVDHLAAHVRDIAEATGRPVHLIGHNRGARFARAVAAQIPDQVGGLITLRAPSALRGPRLHTLLAAATLAAAGTLGASGCARLVCLAGGCCRGVREVLRRPCPAGVAFSSIHHDCDENVPARSGPRVDGVGVPSRHLARLTGHRGPPGDRRSPAAPDRQRRTAA